MDFYFLLLRIPGNQISGLFLNIVVLIVCPPGNWRSNVQRKKKSERGRWGSSCRTRLLQVKMGTNILIMGAAVLVIKIHDTKQCGVSQLHLVTI